MVFLTARHFEHATVTRSTGNALSFCIYPAVRSVAGGTARLPISAGGAGFSSHLGTREQRS